MGVLRTNNSVPTIEDSFSGKNLFVTGASGFIGKVLLEKLLRSCSSVGNIYILLREKKGKSLDARLNQMLSLQLFGPLKEQHPEVLKKIVPIRGDTSKIGLGLSDEDRNLLINEVSVVIHVAASVRFDDPLKTAILQNVRSVREVIHVVEQLKTVTVFVHVSTAFCVCDHDLIEERLYPAHLPWRDVIRIAEEADELVAQALTEKILGELPNTYTFTKSLAEHVVNDMCKGKFPTVIMRPSIVMSALTEPLSGWVDNFSGPYSLFAGHGMGILRTLYGDQDHIQDHISVDNFVKSLIIAAWLKAVEKENINELIIYNCCSDYRCTIDDYNSIGGKVFEDYPLEKNIWARCAPTVTLNWYYYFINFILFQLLPAFFIDCILKLSGKKPMLLSIQRNVYNSNMCLIFFMTKNIFFKTENYNRLTDHLLEKDKRQFTKALVTPLFFNTVVVRGVKQYLFKETVPTPQRILRIDKGLIILDKVVKAAWYILFIYIVFSYRHIGQQRLERLYDYVENL